MSQFEKFKTSEDAAKHAEANGFEVYHGDATTLLLDLDSGEAFRQFELNRDFVDKLVGIDDYTVWNSQNSKHHVLLKLKKPISIELRLFFQACLGSDIERELATYQRILEGEPEPVMLFRPRKWGNMWKKQTRLEGATRVSLSGTMQGNISAQEIPAEPDQPDQRIVDDSSAPLNFNYIPQRW
jgi:hypothetical protein